MATQSNTKEAIAWTVEQLRAGTKVKYADIILHFNVSNSTARKIMVAAKDRLLQPLQQPQPLGQPLQPLIPVTEIPPDLQQAIRIAKRNGYSSVEIRRAVLEFTGVLIDILTVMRF